MSTTTTTEPLVPTAAPVPAAPAVGKDQDHPPVSLEQGFTPYRITADRYQRMVDAAVFDPKDPVFLWRGRLVRKMTKKQPHNIALAELNTILCRMVPAGWHVRPEQPVRFDDDSVPEPDLTVVRGASRDYPKLPPTPRDVALVIEVADSSLAVDSGELRRAYAAAAIPIYWLWDLVDRRLQVYSDPTGPDSNPDYRNRRDLSPDEEAAVILDGRDVGRITVRDALP